MAVTERKGSVRNVGQGCAGHVSRKYDSSEKCCGGE